MRTTQDAHPSFTNPPPKCPHCGASLPASRARVQVFHRWFCPDGAVVAALAALRSLTPEPAPRPTRSLPRERVCTSCGAVSLVESGRGCPSCGASCFALRPVSQVHTGRLTPPGVSSGDPGATSAERHQGEARIAQECAVLPQKPGTARGGREPAPEPQREEHTSPTT